MSQHNDLLDEFDPVMSPKQTQPPRSPTHHNGGGDAAFDHHQQAAAANPFGIDLMSDMQFAPNNQAASHSPSAAVDDLKTSIQTTVGVGSPDAATHTARDHSPAHPAAVPSSPPDDHRPPQPDTPTSDKNHSAVDPHPPQSPSAVPAASPSPAPVSPVAPVAPHDPADHDVHPASPVPVAPLTPVHPAPPADPTPHLSPSKDQPDVQPFVHPLSRPHSPQIPDYDKERQKKQYTGQYEGECHRHLSCTVSHCRRNPAARAHYAIDRSGRRS